MELFSWKENQGTFSQKKNKKSTIMKMLIQDLRNIDSWYSLILNISVIKTRGGFYDHENTPVSFSRNMLPYDCKLKYFGKIITINLN